MSACLVWSRSVGKVGYDSEMPHRPRRSRDRTRLGRQPVAVLPVRRGTRPGGRTPPAICHDRRHAPIISGKNVPRPKLRDRSPRSCLMIMATSGLTAVLDSLRVRRKGAEIEQNRHSGKGDPWRAGKFAARRASTICAANRCRASSQIDRRPDIQLMSLMDAHASAGTAMGRLRDYYRRSAGDRRRLGVLFAERFATRGLSATNMRESWRWRINTNPLASHDDTEKTCRCRRTVAVADFRPRWRPRGRRFWSTYDRRAERGAWQFDSGYRAIDLARSLRWTSCRRTFPPAC